MSLSIIRSNPVAALPAWSCKTVLLEPYKEGCKRIAKGFSCGKDAPKPFGRVVAILSGAGLLIPVLNIILYVAMRTFCAGPAPKLPIPPKEPVKPIVPPKPPEKKQTDNFAIPFSVRPPIQPPKPHVIPKPILPVVPPPKPKPTISNGTLPASNLPLYEERLVKAVTAARNAVKEISDINFHCDISKLVESLGFNTAQLLRQCPDDLVACEIIHAAELELETIVSNIQELIQMQRDPFNYARLEDYHISDQAKDWGLQIRNLAFGSSMQDFQKLLEEGASKGYLNQRSPIFFGGTLYHHLAKLDQYKDHVAKVLQVGVDPTLPDLFGNTGLIWAIANASNEMAMHILNLVGPRAYLNWQCKNHRNTAMHLCVAKGYKEVSRDGKKLLYSNLQILQTLIDLKADVNLKNREGNTPLHLACARRDVSMIRALIKAGANPRIPNNKGRVPQELLQLGHHAASEMLTSTAMVILLSKAEYEANLKEATDLFA